MLLKEAQAQFEEVCSGLSFEFMIRRVAVKTTSDPTSGEVWGGTATHNWYAKVENGTIVEQITVGHVQDPVEWYVNGKFLRSIYRES